MRHLPHGNKKWILHCVDLWSKFNFAYALEAKSARNVANVLNITSSLTLVFLAFYIRTMAENL